MLQNINLNPKSSNTSNDAIAAKSIIKILFAFVDEKTRNDKKMTLFLKGIILKSLPGIRDGSTNYIDEMDSLSIKKLLNDIENQLKNRNKYEQTP